MLCKTNDMAAPWLSTCGDSLRRFGFFERKCKTHLLLVQLTCWSTSKCPCSQILSRWSRQLCVLVWGYLCVVRCDTANPTHTSCSAQGQMVHLLSERAHHIGRLHGHSVVHGWRDHCTLREAGKNKQTNKNKKRTRWEELRNRRNDGAFWFSEFLSD